MDAGERRKGDSGIESFDRDSNGADQEDHSPSYYSIPPPARVRTRSKNAEPDNLHEAPAQSESAANLATVAVMEMEDIVLFPGSTIPLRLHDRNWVTYLGQLIDDARGLYGSHRGTSGGMGEVRIVILPRVSAGTRRTPRRLIESGGRTGRWRVDLVSRGVTSMRSLTRRRRRSESTETVADGNPSGNEEGDRRTGEENGAPTDVVEDSGPRRRQRDFSYHSSSQSEVDLFRRPSAPQEPYDPLIGRIGTMATITFTHEENASAVNPDESPLSDANNDSASRGRPPPRQSSIVWRDRGEELVITVLGTTRVRLIRSMKDDKTAQGLNVRIPLYLAEEIRDRSVTLPPSWLLRPPGDFKCSIATPDNAPCGVKEEEGIDNERQVDQVVYGDSYNSSIQNFSLRSSVPAIACQAIWPWTLCRNIYNMIKESDEFEGLCKIPAAGLRYAVECEEDVDITDETPFQVVDCPAFADWISANLPLSQNDRLYLLEMTNTVSQLRYILQKLEYKIQETTLCCKHCGAGISQMRHVFSVGGSG